MGRARYNTGLFPLPDNVLPVQLFGGTSEGLGVCHAQAQPPQTKNIHPKPTDTTPKRTKYTGHKTHTKTKNPFYGKI